jgi:hypothetical protein
MTQAETACVTGLTEEDLNMLDYFWNQKEDLERWSSWKDRKPAIQATHPEIIKAWEDYKMARRILTAIIAGSRVISPAV